MRRVTDLIAAFLPAARPRARRGLGLIFAAIFYPYAVVAVVRGGAVAAAGRGEVVSVTLAGLALWAGAVALPAVAEVRGRWLRGFDRRFRGHPAAVVGLTVVLVLVAAALLAPALSGGDPLAQPRPLAMRYMAPSAVHPFGTDRFGRDVWTRVLFGARVSLGVGVVAVLLSVIAGTLFGAVAGFASGRVDSVMMRVVDGLLAFPRLVFVLTLVALFPPSVGVLVVAIAATGWMGVARLVRGEVLRLREREWMEAAVASGVGRARLVMRHLLPNAAGPVVVAATLNLGAVILLEAYLSFLGLGIQPPAPSWGAMVYQGRDVLLDAWWVSAFPAAVITVAVVGFNLVGDGLRDAIDVKTRG